MKAYKARIIFLIISIISFFISILSESVYGYDILFLMPLTLFICLIVDIVMDSKSYQKNNNVGIAIINFLALIKYSIMPIVIIVNKDFYGGVLTGQIPSLSDIKIAIILCCIECISIYIAMNIYKFFQRKNSNKSDTASKVTFGPVMIILFCVSLVLILKYFDSFFPSNLFVLTDEYETVQIESSVDGLIKIVFYLFKIFGLLFILQFFSQKYNERPKIYYFLGMIATVLLYFALNLGTSRWNLIIPIIIVLYIFRKIWFKTMINKLIIISILVIVLISFVSITQYKFNWLIKGHDDSINRVIYVLSSQIQEYFSGPRAIAQGIEATRIYHQKISYKTLLNDFSGSIPMISHFVNQSDRINIYYNYFLKGTQKKATQIMPMITIGYAYFGYALCYIFSMICIIFSCIFGNKVSSASNCFHKYIFMYASIWFAMCIGFNTQIIFGWIISSFFPFIIVLYFNEKIVFKR